jgi:hypothetical protein
MNLASSRTVYAMSGREHVARYMHLPTSAAYGKELAFAVSSFEAAVKRVAGSIGVETELLVAKPKSRSIDSVYAAWCRRSVRVVA